MPKEPVTLIRGDKVRFETDYGDALSVNMYPVNKPILGAAGYMIATPGLTLEATGEGIDRGGNYNERHGTQYRVSGSSLIEVNANGTTTDLGTISGTKQAAMPYSFNTQCIIADSRTWLYDSTNGFREVTDSDLDNPIDGVWVDGYYFLTDGEYLYHTDIDDESAIDPLKFDTAQFSPDPTLGVSKTQDNYVIAWGRYSAEYFDNVATANFAFQRLESRAQKIGIVATHAKCEASGVFYFCGGRKDESLGVWILTLGSSTKVSTREVDKILAEYTEPELSDMRMESRMEDDITFIYVHLPNETLCFNQNIASEMSKSEAWSILKTGATGPALYRAINGVFDARLGYWVYGDKRDDKIGKLDKDVFTHYSERQEWILYTPFMDLDTFSIDELELDTIPGHTLVDDATVAFSVTSDGITYSKEYWNLYGESLDYGHRFYLRRLGNVVDWIGFKFRGATSSRMAFGLLKVTYA